MKRGIDKSTFNDRALSGKDKRHALGRPNSDEAPPTDLFVSIGFGNALQRTWRSPYIYANIVYIAYAALILTVDAHPDLDISTTNDLFMAAAVVHLVNACMYIWVWLDAGYSLRNPLLIADYLNILEAILYLITACMYRYEKNSEDESPYASSSSSSSDYSFSESFGDPADPVLDAVHCIELVAAIVQLFAACGWVTQWYLTYQRVTGRGYTLDDPDIWANFTIIIPSIIYVVYNIQILVDKSQYHTNFSYVTADKIYMCNAVFYFMGGLRDVGWFWFMPTAGKFPKFSSDVPLLANDDD